MLIKPPPQKQPFPQQRKHGLKPKLSLAEDALKKANVENKEYSLISDKPNK